MQNLKYLKNLTNYDSLHQIFKEQNIDKVVHLAAQAGQVFYQ